MQFSLWNGVCGPKGHVENPTWSEVEQGITVACDRSASVRLYLVDGAFGQDFVSLAAQDGNLLLDFFCNTSDDDEEVISLSNPNWKSELHGWFDLRGPAHSETDSKNPTIQIHGNYWDARSVTRDVKLVKSIFKEFFETGSLTHPSMHL